MKFNKAFWTEYAMYLASVAMTIALVLLIPANVAKSHGATVFCVVLIVLFVLAAAALLYIGIYLRATVKNYFLTVDGNSKKMPVNALTAARVKSKVDEYVADYTTNSLTLFEDFPRALRAKLASDPKFRPVVVYRMLAALGAAHAETITTIFENTEEKVFTYVCHTLSESNDVALADYIYGIKKNGEDPQKFVAFIKRNEKVFSERLLTHVKKRIHQFDIFDED